MTLARGAAVGEDGRGRNSHHKGRPHCGDRTSKAGARGLLSLPLLVSIARGFLAGPAVVEDERIVRPVALRLLRRRGPERDIVAVDPDGRGAAGIERIGVAGAIALRLGSGGAVARHRYATVAVGRTAVAGIRDVRVVRAIALRLAAVRGIRHGDRCTEG